MKKTLIFIVLAVALALIVGQASAMIGGVLDTAHPNVGAIMMLWPQIVEPDEPPILGRLCTATLIHPQALVTAAHCCQYYENQGIDINQVWVTFDQDPFDENSYLDVAAFIPYPDFQVGGKDSSDIALIILTEPLDSIAPQQLPQEGYLDKQLAHQPGKAQQELKFIVVGYGTSIDLWETPYIQLDAKRHSGTVTFEKLLEMEIKSSNGEENVQLCFGDSGGPLFYINNQGEEVLVGVYSRSGVQYGCLEPMFHLRLDTPLALDFIQENLPSGD